MMNRLRFLSAPIFLAALAACQSTGGQLAPVEQDPAPELIAAEPEPVAPATMPVAPVTPPPKPVAVTTSSFIGKPASSLEAVIGEPAFKRTEMAGEFRRYDLGPCRVYAVIAPDGGGRPVIGSLSISGQTPAQAPMSLDECIKAA